jgi:hypothetical protein
LLPSSGSNYCTHMPRNTEVFRTRPRRTRSEPRHRAESGCRAQSGHSNGIRVVGSRSTKNVAQADRRQDGYHFDLHLAGGGVYDTFGERLSLLALTQTSRDKYNRRSTSAIFLRYLPVVSGAAMAQFYIELA